MSNLCMKFLNKKNRQLTTMKKKLISYTPYKRFFDKLPQNTSFALVTVPLEALAVQKILAALQNKPTTYQKILARIGFKGLWAGTGYRVGYVLCGTFATVLGVDTFGKEFEGMTKTSLAKNALLPLSLLSNARQTGMPWKETIPFVAKGSLSPIVHGSFFARNYLANLCLIPGFQTKKYLDKDYPDQAVVGGFMVAVCSSTVLNTALKPFFTGASTWPRPLKVAWSGTAMGAICMRELMTSAVIFGSLK